MLLTFEMRLKGSHRAWRQVNVAPTLGGLRLNQNESRAGFALKGTADGEPPEVRGFISRVIGPKRQWRLYKARARQLPASYRTALDALQRYLNYYGGTGGDGTALYADLIDMLEQSAANGTPIRQVVGEDPVEFIETFVRNYPKGQWIIRERERLTKGIERAAGEETGRQELRRHSVLCRGTD